MNKKEDVDKNSSKSNIEKFLNSKKDIVNLLSDTLFFEDLIKFLEDFYSLNQFNIDKDWIKIENIDDMPDDLDLDVKKFIVEFESHSNNFNDGNEWGKTYNLTTGEDYGLKTDGLPYSVSLDVGSENNNDLLLVIHTHSGDCLPSKKDLFNCLIKENNIKYMVIINFTEVMIINIKNKCNYNEFIQIIEKEVDHCFLNAAFKFRTNNRNFNNILKINYIKSPIFKKYMDFYWWLK